MNHITRWRRSAVWGSAGRGAPSVAATIGENLPAPTHAATPSLFKQVSPSRSCTGRYSFVSGSGRGRQLSCADAWKGFEKTLVSEGCTSIPRYPVVARWRNDVDFTAAGIYCFQPHCVTGEADPPANPLICPQFCLRFNDLDNIGITGRHYSGFVMLGIQAFNSSAQSKPALSKDDCIRVNYKWLTEELKIDPDEITFTEDVWAGGGNLGPAVEYFVGGLELGNMVFMQYRTTGEGKLIDLPLKVVDVGIGLERIPWLVNRTPTSYENAFGAATDFLRKSLELANPPEIWERFAPYSCQLNVDEAGDISKAWEKIGALVGMKPEAVQRDIGLTKDLYITLDHTRSALMAIEDGALPSNIGGGGNVRNVLRRTFGVLHRNGWWERLGMDGFMRLFDLHRSELSKIYGPFAPHRSFRKIVELEYDRWLSTDDAQRKQVEKLKKQRKGRISLGDWVVAVSSWGVPADRVAEMVGQPVPANLYYEIAAREEKSAKVVEELPYGTSRFAETRCLYYESPGMTEFVADILGIMENKTPGGKGTILVLDKTAFYPLSGGQQSDTGSISIAGENLEVLECLKAGKCVLHVLNKSLAGPLASYVVRTTNAHMSSIGKTRQLQDRCGPAIPAQLPPHCRPHNQRRLQVRAGSSRLAAGRQKDRH